MRSWSVPVDKPLNEAGLIRIPVDSDTGGVLPTGIYLIRVTSPEQSQNDFGGTTRHLMVVADNNVTLKAADKEGLVWATNLQSGQETPNVPISIYDPDFNQLASGTTDQSGLYQVRRHRAARSQHQLDGGDRRLWRAVWRRRERLECRHRAVGLWRVRQLLRQRRTTPISTPTSRSIGRDRRCTSKASCALDDDARYAIDPNLKLIDVLIYDAQGKQVYTGTQPLNDYGTFNFDFALDGEAALGGYSIQAQIPVRYPGQEVPIVQYYNGTFVVAEYRRPEFQVNVTAAKD